MIKNDADTVRQYELQRHARAEHSLREHERAARLRLLCLIGIVVLAVAATLYSLHSLL